eukprot:gene17725-21135_t
MLDRAIGAAVCGGNLHALKTLHSDPAAAKALINIGKVYVDAFIGPNSEILEYLVDNIPFSQSAEFEVIKVDNAHIKPAHLERYILLKTKVIFRQTIHDPSKYQDVNLEFFEHVIKACAMGSAREVERITAVRPRVKSLTSTLTPLKETYLTMFEYLAWVDGSMAQFEFMIEWRDLELSSYLANKFGFATICSIGNLAQVQEAHRVLGSYEGERFRGSMESKDLDVLRYLHDNDLATCDQCRLLNEDNLEIIKFIMETQHKHMQISKQFLFSREAIDALQYLSNKEYIDVDAMDEFIDLFDITCRSLKMMQYLVGINYNFNYRLLDESSSGFLDTAVARGHMDIARFIIANRCERFQYVSCKTAAAADDIELYEFICANTRYLNNSVYPLDFKANALETANLYVEDYVLACLLDKCLKFDQHHVLDYYLCNFEQINTIDTILPLIMSCLSPDRLGCLQVLLKHLPAEHQDFSLYQFIQSLPPGTITWPQHKSTEPHK